MKDEREKGARDRNSDDFDGAFEHEAPLKEGEERGKPKQTLCFPNTVRQQ